MLWARAARGGPAATAASRAAVTAMLEDATADDPAGCELLRRAGGRPGLDPLAGVPTGGAAARLPGPTNKEVSASEGNGVHTVHRDGAWFNEAGGRQIDGAYDHKDAAVSDGRQEAIAHGTEHRIHGLDGQVHEKWWVGAFVVQPRRWVVERTNGWINRHRSSSDSSKPP